MTINDKIRDEKLQYDISRKAAKRSALSSAKNDRYKYLIGEEILLSNQRQIIEQTKFAYSPLSKTFEKQIKAIEDKGEKQTNLFEYYGKQLVESNELIKNDFNIDKDDVPVEKQKLIFNENLLNIKT